jgi:hypothetical protein
LLICLGIPLTSALSAYILVKLVNKNMSKTKKIPTVLAIVVATDSDV